VTITLKGRSYTLSERRAAEVLGLTEAARRKPEGERDGMDNVLTMAQIVRDALKATHRLLGPWRGWRYGKFRKTAGLRLLLAELSIDQLAEACRFIVEDLEGYKKKAQQERESREKQSAER
jgi:hypothetical protein